MGLAQASMWTITWPRCASTRIVVGSRELPGGGRIGHESRSGYQELELKLGYTTEASDETYLGLTDEDFGRTPLARYPASRCGSHGRTLDHSQIQSACRGTSGREATRILVTTTAYRNDFSRNWYKLQSVLGTSIWRMESAVAVHKKGRAACSERQRTTHRPSAS